MATPPDFSNGTALDASSLDKIGLWKVGSVSASNTTVALDNVFTADFESYRIIVRQTYASATGTTLFRFRAAGAAIATNDYYYGGSVYRYNANGEYWYAGTTSSFVTMIASGSVQTHSVIDVSFPRSTNRKQFTATSTCNYSNYIGTTTHGIVNLTADTYDGFQLTQDAAGTLTISAVVYGYNQL